MITLTENYYILTIELNKSGASHLSLPCKGRWRHTGDTSGRGRQCLNFYTWAPCGTHWPRRTLSLRSEHMDPFWSFWHRATSCKDPKGAFSLPPPGLCNSYLGTHMKFPLITQRCQLGDGVGVVQVNPLLYPSSRGKKQAWLESRDAECQTSGTTENWGSEWKIFWNTPDKHHPFPLPGVSAFSVFRGCYW